MKKICFVTTVAITVKSFLIDFAHYLTQNRDYDVTFICNKDESLFTYTNEYIHYIPVSMKRGIGFDAKRLRPNRRRSKPRTGAETRRGVVRSAEQNDARGRVFLGRCDE